MNAGTFWSVVPSVVAITLALMIKEPHIALLAGGLIGAVFAAGFHPVATLELFIRDGLIKAISDSAGVIAFVVLLGIIIRIIHKTKGAEAFGKWAKRRIKTQRGAVLSTLLLGILIFIDDMFNCFTVGAVMMPVADRNRISRQKLAWLLDATAAPICIIAPISSWGAAVSSTAESLGTGISGLELFVRAIPYNFYSLLTIVFIIGIGILNFDYGPMAKYQRRAENKAEKNNLQKTGGTEYARQNKIPDAKPEMLPENPAERDVRPEAGMIDLVLPIIFLLLVSALSMMYFGGFFDPDSACYLNFALAFGNTDGAVALSFSALIGVVFTVIFALFRKTLTVRHFTECVEESFRVMGSPLIILILAVSLKNMTTLLGASEFLSGIMSGAAEGVYSLLPAVIFVIAGLFAFACGSSWGTFGVMIPIVAAILSRDMQLMVIGISACLAGSVWGDHCSPISDTTIMSSAAAQCDHISHVETQLPYAVTVAGISLIVYMIAGFVRNAPVCLAIGIIIVTGSLFILRRITGSRSGGPSVLPHGNEKR